MEDCCVSYHVAVLQSLQRFERIPALYTEEDTLDLFLTTNPTLITQVSCQPGLSDHDMVIAHCSLTPTTQKQKPRKVPIFRKADWSKFKSLMRDYQQKFLSSHIGKSVEELWNGFTSTLDLYSSQCIPVKTFSGKKSLPWITQEIRRQIRKRNHFYKQFKKTGDQVFRNKFLALRKKIKSKIKLSHETYLEGLLGLHDEDSSCDSKKLFSFLKSSKQGQLGTPALNHKDRLVTETAEKADLHNLQFQSVFTTKAPLSLSRLRKIQDMADCGGIPSEALPPGMQESSPAMEDFDISVAGILKLLKNLKPGKAAGPDRLKPILLKELREEIAPIIQVIFERSIKTGKLPSEWCRAQVSPIFKKGDKSSPANYRPISLTFILCKVLEHIMASHLVRHLNKHDLLYDLQHSFREKRLNQLGWRTLEQRRADARLCLFYKIVYGLVAVPLPNYVQPTHRIFRYCHSMTYRQIQTSTNYYKYSFFPLAIVQWNALPEAVASLPDLDLFKVAVSKLQHTRP